MTTQTEAQQADAEVSGLVDRLTSTGDQDGAKLVRRLVDRHDNTRYWYGVRHKRLWHWAHDELTPELRDRYFSILANGTADVHEEPTYAQQYNQMQWRMKAAEAETASMRSELEALRSAVPAGWRLVPVEPTLEMLQAGRDTPLAGDDAVDAPEDYKAVYRAMLAAAPQPAQGEKQ
jgi:hypothetical protein